MKLKDEYKHKNVIFYIKSTPLPKKTKISVQILSIYTFNWFLKYLFAVTHNLNFRYSSKTYIY